MVESNQIMCGVKCGTAHNAVGDTMAFQTSQVNICNISYHPMLLLYTVKGDCVKE